MKFDRFEDIIAWQKSKELTLLVYKSFDSSKDFGFRDQIQRASVSVMNNIAEGFERKTNNEFKHFCFMAKGSCAEARSMIILARDLEKISPEEFKMVYDLTIEISIIISGLIKTL
jgi:four helix bundle protein